MDYDKELREDRALVEDLRETIERLQEGILTRMPPEWWRRQQLLIQEQHRRIVGLRKRYCG
jgi:hypothetical protein